MTLQRLWTWRPPRAPSVPAPGWPPALRPFLPPTHDRRFWVTVGLVALIEGIHDGVEVFGLWPQSGPLQDVPHESLLFIIPATYAALNFGLRGAIVISVVCTMISIPNWVFLHDADERLGVISQMGIVNFVAVLVGSRVSRETAAVRALHVSATKYRALFESASEGIVVIDERGEIVECNSAAGELFGVPPEEIVYRLVSDALPPNLASTLARCIERQCDSSALPRGQVGRTDCSDVLLARPAGQIWVEPVCAPLPGPGGLTQVVLRDVTEHKRRQSSLETYAARVLHAQEEERRRIAQELHDDTMQSLVLLCRRLDAIEEEAVAAPDFPGRYLEELRGDVESTMESLRVFLHGLRPSILDDLGLTPAIQRLVTELGSRSAIRTDLVVRGGDQRLPSDHELALYRIAQEALRNVERHSEATRSTVTLHHRGREVELSVVDDGKGFLLPAALADMTSESRFGLLGMQERARIVGGTLEIRSAPGAGTTIVATVPAVPGHE